MLKSKIDHLTNIRILQNENHFEFYKRFFRYIAEHGGATGFNVGEPFKPAHALFNEENAALEHIRVNIYTEDIEKHNELRLKAYRSLRDAIKSAEEKPGTESYHAKAVALQTAFEVYRLPRKRHVSYNELSGILLNLIEDMSEPELKGYLVDLKIEDRLTTLVDQYEAFEKLYDKRIEEEGHKMKYDLPKIRKELDQSAWELANAIAYGADREVYKGKYVEFISFYNELVASFQRYINRHHKNKPKDGEYAPVETPEQPGGEADTPVEIKPLTS